ncbi:MAG: dihydroorotate dehydrogenase-like protein [Bacteroidales bacterium]|nr:dihydroorotate dehydrogenase-like protein [Bacteroidales bacterium]
MADLTTKYLGMDLRSPLIIGSSNLPSSVDNIKQMEANGAGAVVLKSLYEEEILFGLNPDAANKLRSNPNYHDLAETVAYVSKYQKEKRLDDYLQFIKNARQKTTIPIISSINCFTDTEWIDFLEKIIDAGANAIELNMFFNPVSLNEQDYENIIIKILSKAVKRIPIPISVKIGNRFDNLGSSLLKIAEKGIKGVVLFNRAFTPDIDTENFFIAAGNVYSLPADHLIPLRWIALISDKIECSIAAATGIHHSNAIIKQILAGADAVQMVSALYLNGTSYLSRMYEEVEKWMNKKGFNTIEDFKGKMNYTSIPNPTTFERMQFMKYYGKIGN